MKVGNPTYNTKVLFPKQTVVPVNFIDCEAIWQQDSGPADHIEGEAEES